MFPFQLACIICFVAFCFIYVLLRKTEEHDIVTAKLTKISIVALCMGLKAVTGEIFNGFVCVVCTTDANIFI